MLVICSVFCMVQCQLIERLQLCLYDVFLLALMIVGVCCFATKLSTNDAALQHGKYMTTNLLSNAHCIRPAGTSENLLLNWERLNDRIPARQRDRDDRVYCTAWLWLSWQHVSIFRAHCMYFRLVFVNDPHRTGLKKNTLNSVLLNSTDVLPQDTSHYV